MLAHFCSLTKKMFTVLTPKTPKNHQATVCNCSKQEERHDKTPAHKIISESHWRHQRVTSGWENNSLILVDHEVKVIMGCYRNVMLL